MWKIVGIIVGTLALMVVSGIVTFFAVSFFLFNFALQHYDNYMYYDTHPVSALAWGAIVIGFLAPGVVVWYLHKRTTRKGRSR